MAGDIESGAPGEFFHWKHLCSPFGPSTRVVAETDSEPVGFYAYIAWRFRAHGQILKAMRGVDLAVHPAHRRSGVSLAIRAEPRFSDSQVGRDAPADFISCSFASRRQAPCAASSNRPAGRS
jgi:hypothetical protein